MLSDILLTKFAHDAGFDVELGGEDGWLKFGLPGRRLLAWLIAKNGRTLVALSRADVLREINRGTDWMGEIPRAAAGAREVASADEATGLLARARALDRTLPDALLEEYHSTPIQIGTTEAEGLVRQRRGQELFRKGLVEYWEGRCAITGLATSELLRASHIKPWAHCESDAERLDIFNGLLLAPHFDALFDQGWITIGDSGDVEVSALLPAGDRKILGLDVPYRVVRLREGHRRYLVHHRNMVYRFGR